MGGRVSGWVGGRVGGWVGGRVGGWVGGWDLDRETPLKPTSLSHTQVAWKSVVINAAGVGKYPMRPTDLGSIKVAVQRCQT